jgi:hypothetical protein
MPYDIKLDAPLVGISTSLALEGEAAAIQNRGFFCSDEPALLSKVLDGFWSSILARLPAGAVPSPSHVRHALAVIFKDGSTTVWVNELEVQAQVLSRRPVDLVLSDISAAVEARLPTFLSGMEARPALAAQIPFIEKAIEHFRKGDFLSSVSVLFPRIEGIWRGIARPAGGVPHKVLATTVVETGATRLSPVSPLLAGRFLEYLKTRFLPKFDPGRPEGLTRHTVSHGVASAEEFNRKGALLGLLIVNQLRYFVPADAEEPPGGSER